MFHKPVSGLAGIALVLVCAARAPAEDFRVYTQIYDVRAPVKPRLVGRSTSLFHAGKVYDKLDSGGNQMTIYEPAHEQFTIIDGSRRIQTVIPFEYVESRLFQVGKKTEQKIAELREKNTPEAKHLADVLEFQLRPVFQESYNAKGELLKLKGTVLSYEVKCAPHDSPEIVADYLAFTDAMARLNYLVHETALLPGPRLQLDQVLRRRVKLPIEVALHSSQEKGLHLRAEHRYDWKLNATDRSVISHWDKLTNASDVKHVSPQQFFEPTASEKLETRR